MEESSVLLDSLKVGSAGRLGAGPGGVASTLSLSPAVHLVQLHDAAGPVCAGAAPPPAEAEAAARSRHHEPAPLSTDPASVGF